MKKFSLIILAASILLMPGCLGFEFYSVKITIDEKNKSEGIIEVEWKNVFSDEDSLAKRENDFKNIITDFLQGDRFLLDQTQQGIYVKNRELYSKNGQLNFKFRGIYRNFNLDGSRLKTIGDKLVITLDDIGIVEEYMVYKANGEISEDKNKTTITWPADQRELYFEFKLTESTKKEEKMYSLMPWYEKWKNGQLEIK